jgi:hypothetical protein
MTPDQVALTLPEAVQAIKALPYVLPAPLGCINRADALALLARVDAVPAEPVRALVATWRALAGPDSSGPMRAWELSKCADELAALLGRDG